MFRHFGVAFRLKGTWARVELDELLPVVQEHISEAWKIGSECRHVDFILDEEWLLSCSCIDRISHRRPKENAGESLRREGQGESCKNLEEAEEECSEV
ncbi:hypothetical protein ACOSQ2_032586 [Xanthoceras sorbifolium]